ncbi:hypothetical protein [Halotia branconii]|uniref:Uncharacterized protein n=1 Tax=Halotia branconii CENA392 TaxID=1539056 RepID=A0AAJ6NQM4_9CYAN|nr:hypothetical protein [Halotia branconii]WGV24773.1 hypothetical protein QI031_23865 [Halotia branconii CENA392]
MRFIQICDKVARSQYPYVTSNNLAFMRSQLLTLFTAIAFL